ncbi:MAG: carboxynorspermidine decarboxylase [Candidatus Omnitrophica bacterium]|jgi:carboxynorspermidine decarboxylase|nr:carboxynorspermidine decarboxylase [Candidatus Omnitrophota bacterium]
MSNKKINLITPYYLIYESKLLKNLKIIERIKKASGAKFVLALKCFSTWAVFPLMRKYLDGTTSSSLYEARLGCEKFKKEVHAYSVAYSFNEIRQIRQYADKIIFNSISQLQMFNRFAGGLEIGLRVNPGISFSCFDLANPARRYSRLGVIDKNSLSKVLPLIDGIMFHFNCENNDFENFSLSLDFISKHYGALLKELKWMSLGGGIFFTKDGYPVDKFCKKIKEFSEKFAIQIYFEPGEAVITQSAELVTKILDIVHNGMDIAIVDSSIEAHMLDLLTYRLNAKIKSKNTGSFRYQIAGRSCLAGDVFGTYRFKARLKVGNILRINDAAGYTMVKKNWFNGLSMPSIVVKRLNGSIDVIHNFEYKDFVNSLS